MKTKYWIALSSLEFLDAVFIKKLYDYFGDIEMAYNAPEKQLSEIEGLSINKTEEFLVQRKKINPDKLYEEVEKRGIRTLTLEDSNYAYMLRQISNPPAVLYYKGDLSVCNLSRTVAFVGSRRASSNGKDSVRRIIGDFLNTDLCIVSGLAEGIDATSHRSALDNNLKTIGVIASGHDFQYPASNKDLYEKIINGHGAVVSEYYPTIEPIKFHFPQRNRIVTGLSYGTVVGEAALRSGALISANLTLEQGRELMCIPGSINNKNTEGVYKLIKNGATMVTSGEDVLNALNWQIQKPVINSEKSLQKNSSGHSSQKDLSLSISYLPLSDIIDIEPKGFDELLAETGMDTEELLKTLTMMEIDGLIEQTEGDRYKRKW